MPLCFDNIKFSNADFNNNNCYAVYRKSTDYGLLEGIVCLLNLGTNKSIDLFLHEKTIAQKVNKYSKSFVETGTQLTPILLSYDTTNGIPDLIDEVINKIGCISKDVEAYNEVNSFKYIIADEQKEHISKYLQKIKEVYLIDGHHRYEAAKNLAKLSGINTIVVMLVARKKLFLDAFHRVIHINDKFSLQDITKKIKQSFDLEKVPGTYIPRTNSYFGMYLKGSWYKLSPKETLGISECNSENLSKYLLKPILNLYEENSQVITYLNSRELLRSEQQCPDAIIFSLSPLSMEKYIDYTRSNIFLPPHTTCFLPKPHNQCLIYNHFEQEIL